MSGALACRAEAEVQNEPEGSRCREAAVLAEDHRGCGPEWDVDSEVLPAAPLEGSQFYWWQRKLKASRQERSRWVVQDKAASFALVSEDGVSIPAGLELVLRDGRRLPIRQGVQEETLRAVLAAFVPAHVQLWARFPV
jgi:hypothetical protein